MNRTEISEKVFEIIKLNLGVKEVQENQGIINDLGADSLDDVELIIEIEKEFEIKIPDEIAEKIVTVKDLIDCIFDYLS